MADSLSKLMGGPRRAMRAAAGPGAAAGGSGDVPLLTFVVDGDGKPQMTALTATKAIFGGIGKAASDGTQGFGADIPDLGDRAVRLANLRIERSPGKHAHSTHSGSRSRRERQSHCHSPRDFAEALEFSGGRGSVVCVGISSK